MKKKVVPKLPQEEKVKVDIVTSDDINIYYTGKFEGFTARYIIKNISVPTLSKICLMLPVLNQLLLTLQRLAFKTICDINFI